VRSAVLPALLATVLLSAPSTGRARPPSDRLPLAPCQLGNALSAERVAARCGTLEVPEDHDRPGGRRIALRVAVIDAESTQAEPDPVFLLAGGPGQAATEAFPPAMAAFTRVNRHRDLVLVDQRGTGGSGRLTCRELEDASALARTPEMDLAAVASCARALSSRADLGRYRSIDFARDLDLVRAALGYDRVNLVGGSYGTRAALVYARAFPGRVRTMALDGVAPLQMAITGAFEEDGQRALELAFRRCAEEPACRARFPDPAGDLAALAAAFDAKSRLLPLRDPLTGAPLALEVRGDTVRQVAMQLAYATETMSLLPALLREARTGDPAPLVAQGLLGAADLGGGVSRPLQLSVLCAEDVPFVDKGPVRPGLFLGSLLRRTFREACARWPVTPVDASFHAPLQSDVPTLLLSGEADPVTPPRWAELAASTLPASRHLVVPGAAHGTLFRGCMPRLLAAFIAAGRAEALDASCLERQRAAPFFLDLAGPSP
jgi:pimeloyl-ACP methyl ester carboxylesterase